VTEHVTITADTASTLLDVLLAGLDLEQHQRLAVTELSKALGYATHPAHQAAVWAPFQQTISDLLDKRSTAPALAVSTIDQVQAHLTDVFTQFHLDITDPLVLRTAYTTLSEVSCHAERLCRSDSAPFTRHDFDQVTLATYPVALALAPLADEARPTP